MMINALNSGADGFMADFEDSLAPHWENVVNGQINLIDAVRRRIEFTNPDGRVYKLNEETATLLVRPPWAGNPLFIPYDWLEEPTVRARSASFRASHTE